jgi:hypothetical protein
VDWWLVPALWFGMGLGLLGSMYSEVDRPTPRLADAVVMLTVGPFVMGWLCATRAIRARRR